MYMDMTIPYGHDNSALRQRQAPGRRPSAAALRSPGGPEGGGVPVWGLPLTSPYALQPRLPGRELRTILFGGCHGLDS